MSVIYDVLGSVIPFHWADYKFMINAFLAVLLIAPLMGVLGTMAVNNKMAFFSDALGHSAFTGIALGVLLGIQNEIISLVAFGVLIALIITRVKNRGNSSSDTVISVFSSTSIAIGLLVLSYGGSFSKYSSYLVGDILSITQKELLYLLITFVAVIIVWSLIYNKLLVITVNRELAASRGIKTTLYENIFVIMVAVVVMISIKWVGILLINSLLILPAAAARNIAKNSRLVSGIITGFCSIGSSDFLLCRYISGCYHCYSLGGNILRYILIKKKIIPKGMYIYVVFTGYRC